ncbi:MAG: hypothetical protein PSY14_13390 [bacterium]|nr:hypothetical protein [bacterium]
MSNKFNWLAEPPKHHFTLGEAVHWATDGELMKTPPHKWGRAARIVDRATMVVGLGAAVAICMIEKSPLPMLMVPVVAKGVAFIAAAITQGITGGLANTIQRIERFTAEREFKRENKKDLPRGMR